MLARYMMPLRTGKLFSEHVTAKRNLGLCVRRLVSINVLDAVIQGVYMWIIPLLLLERNISLTTVGFVFAAYPVVFLVCRLLLASVADSIGLKRIFQVNALGSLASAVLYAASISPFSYAIAKATQAVKDSSLWAVNRNATYQITGNENPQMAASMILFIRALAVAAGAIVSSVLLAQIGFQAFFVSLIFLSGLMLVPATMLDIGFQSEKLSLNVVLRRIDPRSMPRRLWRISIVMGFSTIASTFVTGYIAPIFLHSRGLGYWEIGMISASYVGAGALLIPVTLHGRIRVRDTLLIQSLLYLPAAILIPLSGGGAMIILIMLMALGESTGYITWESLVREAAKGQEDMATAIGLAHLPSNLVMIPVFIAAGFLTESFGYIAPFWIAGISFFLYSTSAWHFLKPRG